MRHNNLTNYGRDLSCLLKLVEILPQTKIESLGCAATRSVRFFVSALLTLNTSLLSCARSLSFNRLGP